MTTRFTTVLLMSMAVSLVGHPVSADTTWIGAPGVEGDWNNPANWSNGLPAAQVATIMNGGTAGVNGAATAKTLSVGPGRVSVGPDGQLTAESIAVSGSITQSGGTVGYPWSGSTPPATPTTLTVAAGGTYTLNTGSLITMSWEISGTFIQSGGVSNLPNQQYTCVVNIQSGGLFRVDGGQAGVGRTNVSGTFTQTGGTFTHPGYSSSSTIMEVAAIGRVNISGGTFGQRYASSSTWYQMWLSGQAEQTGGRVELGNLSVHSGAQYRLRSTGSLYTSRCYVTGRLSQEAGTHESAAVDIRGGNYDLLGGSLAATSLTIGSNGGGTLTLSDTQNKRVRRLVLGAYGSLHCGAASELSIVPDAGFGDTASNPLELAIQGTSSANYSGLRDLTLGFSVAQYQGKLEVAGRPLPAGTASELNFSIGTLELTATGGSLLLADASDNQPTWSGKECLYLKHLVINTGSRLDLNGLDLYYEDASIASDATINYAGGHLINILDSALPGDANLNGSVGFDDYLALEAAFGQSFATPGSDSWRSGDFTRDGTVDFADYLILEANFGSGAPVPEPLTLSMLLAGSAILSTRNRHPA